MYKNGSFRKRCESREAGPEWYFRELFQAHRTASLSLFAHFGIKEFGQPIILFILESEDSYAPTQKELADQLGIAPSTTTISLKSLERLGCVRKVSDENDMRCKRIEITDKGRVAAKKFREAFYIIEQAMYNGFSNEERETISQLHKKITSNLLDLADSYNQSGERN